MSLKSPTTELLFYESPISTLLYEIRTSEQHYRDQLSKLLGCCSPLKRQAANGFTNSVRKLIAYHTDLVRSLDHVDEVQSIYNFIQWTQNSIPVYQNYVANYQLDSNSLQIEIQLKKNPLIRINQLNKYFNKIIEINENHTGEIISFDSKISQNLMKLMQMAKDKNEMENLRIDLNTLLFNKVHSLDLQFSNTVGFFQLDQSIKRDYFKFDLLHPKSTLVDTLVEVFQLSNNTLAICSVESIGRSLMFPPLKNGDFEIISNDLNLIHLQNDDDVELKFTCPDKSQLSYWNGIIKNLFNNNGDDVGSNFQKSHYKLQDLKNDKMGLGIKLDDNQSIGSLLRRSSPILSKHTSLASDYSNQILSEISPNLSNIDQFFAHDADLNKLNSYTSDQDAKVARNNSITPRLNSVPRSTTQDSFSSGEEITSKNVESIGTPSPTLPLNIKKSIKTTNLNLQDLSNSSTVSLPNFQSSQPNLLNLNTAINPQPSQSMASLQKNVKNLTISTSSTSSTTESPLPSPFARSNTKQHSLTPFEETTLASSTITRVLKNNTIVSKWSQSHWESIGEEYGHVVKFLSSSQGRLFVLYQGDGSIIPELMIPTEGACVNKSSALDLQIKCYQSVESKKMMMLNVRVKDVYTLRLIMNEFENKETLSASNSDVFSAPSNSTSMSSVNVDEIQELGKPYKNGHVGSGSSTSLHTKTLLLKSDVKIKLHKLDQDEEWRPISIGKFNISSNLGNPEYSKFEINCNDKTRIETIVKNSNCSRIGRTGLTFNFVDDELEIDQVNYLIEFRNSQECVEIYEMLI
ncbi:unnamed protein product [Wickerhamomyces anomalus]